MIAALLPAAILGTGAWGAWHLTWTETERDLIRAADVNADYVRRNVESLARVAARIADAVARDQPSAPIPGMPPDRIRDLLREQPLVRAVLVDRSDGRPSLHVDTRLPPGAAAEPADGGIAQALADAPPGRVVLGRAYRAGDVVLLAMGLRSQLGGPAVVIVLDATEIGDALSRHTDSPTDSVALIRSDGQILARQPPFLDPPPALGPQRPLMQMIAAGQDSGTLMGATPRDEHPVAVAFSRVPGFADLVIAVGRRNDEIEERWRQVMVPLMLVGLPAVFALMGLALVVRRQQDALEATLGGLEQRVAERTDSLREGEERLRLAVEAGQLGTWETELNSGLSTRSPRATEILGFPPDNATTPVDDWGARIHPADRARVLELWGRVVAGQSTVYRAEYRYLRAEGVWRWLESSGTVVRRDPATGRPLRLAGTIQDITERHDAEERRDLLTQEVNHRARNTLAIVQAILRLTQAGTPAEFARLVEGRIAALARAQSLLAAERWTGVPLATLIADEIAPFGGIAPGAPPGGGRFRLDGPAFRIRADAVQALGMVFHELATNAAKYGALSVPDGTVSVAWAMDEEDALLRMRWSETGGPPPGFPTRRGVGSRVIEATVTGQLGGRVERRWPEEGLICDIAVPLGRVRAGPG
ncbi:HWE histidine kinase domain-containing protein [Roseomonas sp. CAU 1739]|uniref:HWE histidine kinase domain-containing protein n=1 Tax=Roseomonas sp. CAU 1739 TaxID=3140364 RepID=UPI00325A7F90